MLNEAGWAISPQDCMEIFIGKTVRSEAARIEAHTGQLLTDAWMAQFYACPQCRAASEPAAHRRCGGCRACRASRCSVAASPAPQAQTGRKVEMQLAQVGLASYFGDRVFQRPRNAPHQARA